MSRIGLPLLILIIAGCGGSSPSVRVTYFPQPQTTSAGAVARSLGATGFTDCGRSLLGGVTDSGTARYHGFRIGIDVFPTAAARVSWLNMALSAADVVPLAEGGTWVAYKAVEQDAEGCS